MDREFIKTKQNLNSYMKHLREKVDMEGTRKLAYEDAAIKLAGEMNLLKDSGYADIVGIYLCRRCADPAYEARVLQPQKTLQKCLDYIMGKIYERVRKKSEVLGAVSRQNTAVAVREKEVYKLADEYYALDDAKEEVQKKEEGKRQFLENREAETNKGGQGKAPSGKRSEKPDRHVKAEKKDKKAAEENQMSIFDILPSGTFEEGKGTC